MVISKAVDIFTKYSLAKLNSNDSIMSLLIYNPQKISRCRNFVSQFTHNTACNENLISVLHFVKIQLWFMNIAHKKIGYHNGNKNKNKKFSMEEKKSSVIYHSCNDSIVYQHHHIIFLLYLPYFFFLRFI